MHFRTAGVVWIGGLNRFDPETETFIRYTVKEGLPNSIVYGVLEDTEGNLWLSTNKGISCFNPSGKAFKNFTPRDGLQGYEYNHRAYHLGWSGEMFFGGPYGFNAFFPERITENPHVPQVVMTDFRIFNKPVAVGGDSPLKRHISETKEIVNLILKGKTNRDIEEELFISIKTVKCHVYNIYRKFDVQTRLELIRLIQKSAKI